MTKPTKFGALTAEEQKAVKAAVVNAAALADEELNQSMLDERMELVAASRTRVSAAVREYRLSPESRAEACFVEL